MMNLENQFLEIKNFLLKHLELLNSEVLDNYEVLKNHIYHNWANELKDLGPEELISLESGEEMTHSKYSIELTSFIKTCKRLTKINKLKFYQDNISKNLVRKLSLKKQHEIIQIKELLKDLSWTKALDIGSGAGHLSSILIENNLKESTCIDLSSDYQEIGKKKLQKNAPDILKRLQFITKEISTPGDISDIDFDLLVGLHSCGDLSVNLIKLYSKNNKEGSHLLNFGCCYHKLTDDHINISKISQKDDVLKLTNHALTMAAKSYKKLTPKELLQRQKVKNYRYAIHILMKNELKIGFKTLGNAKSSDYDLPFSQYCHKYLDESRVFSEEFLEKFYKDHFETVKYIQRLGIIRSFLSRVLELYIILDRVLYLKENGHNPKILESFDKALSPRNIAIIV